MRFNPQRLFFGARPSRWAVGVPIVAMLAGVLFAQSFKTAQGSDLRSEGRGLPEQIRVISRAVEAKTARLDRLFAEVEALTTDQAPTSSALQQLTTRSDTLALAAGRVPVKGPGVTVTLTDAPLPGGVIPQGFTADDVVVHQQDVQAVANALWRGGAEAMMIQDQRIISTSAVRCVGNTLILQGRVYSPPYVITAVGRPSLLQAALVSDPQVAIYREYVDAIGLGYAVDSSEALELPAYSGSVAVQFARVPRS
jgi:uncharacterized protein YlxW (UPF0749 family)